jgi:hypothetical protein
VSAQKLEALKRALNDRTHHRIALLATGKHAWGEVWIPPIGPPGNMPVSGSKGPEQLAVEVAGLSSLFFGR